MKIELYLALILGVFIAFLPARETVAQRDDSAALMLAAAQDFVAALSAEQRETCVFPVEKEVWEKWHYIPMRNRTGLNYEQMTPEQVRLADSLVSSGMSRLGYHKAKTIMSLEQLIYELEIQGGRTPFTNIRKPDYYYFAIYGTPQESGVWGWRVEGHHLSLHFGMQDGEVISSSPTFMGAEPHNVVEGRRKGLRTLGREEDLARALLGSLTDKQLGAVLTSDKAPNDILTRNASEVDWSSVPDEGLKRSEMTQEQQGMLQALINEYIFNVPRDLARRRIDIVEESGDDIAFVWMGSTTFGIGNPHYFRVHGKTFLIEFDNIQLNANHSHTVWRDYENDFGRDVLAEHYRTAHAR